MPCFLVFWDCTFYFHPLKKSYSVILIIHKSLILLFIFYFVLYFATGHTSSPYKYIMLWNVLLLFSLLLFRISPWRYIVCSSRVILVSSLYNINHKYLKFVIVSSSKFHSTSCWTMQSYSTLQIFFSPCFVFSLTFLPCTHFGNFIYLNLF